MQGGGPETYALAEIVIAPVVGGKSCVAAALQAELRVRVVRNRVEWGVLEQRGN